MTPDEAARTGGTDWWAEGPGRPEGLVDWLVPDLFAVALGLAACANTSREPTRARITEAIDRLDEIIRRVRVAALQQVLASPQGLPAAPADRRAPGTREPSVSTPPRSAGTPALLDQAHRWRYQSAVHVARVLNAAAGGTPGEVPAAAAIRSVPLPRGESPARHGH